jgi:hypothetical protein
MLLLKPIFHPPRLPKLFNKRTVPGSLSSSRDLLRLPHSIWIWPRWSAKLDLDLALLGAGLSLNTAGDLFLDEVCYFRSSLLDPPFFFFYGACSLVLFTQLMDPFLLVLLLFWVLCLLPSSSSLLQFPLSTTYESVGGCYRSKVDKYPSKSPLFLGSSDIISQLLGGPRPNYIVYGTPHWVRGAINYCRCRPHGQGPRNKLPQFVCWVLRETCSEIT